MFYGEDVARWVNNCIAYNIITKLLVTRPDGYIGFDMGALSELTEDERNFIVWLCGSARGSAT